MTTVTIDLSTGAPPSPDRTRQLAKTFAELVRVMNHATMHHEALGEPSDADRVVRELSSAAARLPQLCAQIGGWLQREQDAGRIEVAGEDPAVSVMAAVMNLEDAAAAAVRLQGELDAAASVTSTLAAREDGGDE